MRLSEFMLSNREHIIAEWVAFARSSSPTAETMELAILRDHAEQILETIAADLNTGQSKTEQADKSKGKRDAQGQRGADQTAAQTHGAARAESGFSVGQMVSEYRALRASVLRLWLEAVGELTSTDLEDLTRFNEAIDQAVAESIARHSEDLERSKDMFLAMLGHDLRTPLGAILGAARVISASNDPAKVVPNNDRDRRA